MYIALTQKDKIASYCTWCENYYESVCYCCEACVEWSDASPRLACASYDGNDCPHYYPRYREEEPWPYIDVGTGLIIKHDEYQLIQGKFAAENAFYNLSL